MKLINKFILLNLLLVFLQACSGNGFHLRKNVDLPVNYQSVKFENIPEESEFTLHLQNALEEAGGRVDEKSDTTLLFDKFTEGRRVIAYTKDRLAREYLLFLNIDYFIQNKRKQPEQEISVLNKKKHHIRIDRSFIYDANFALGKAEEEKQIRQNLYQEAARLILLKLQYSSQ